MFDNNKQTLKILVLVLTGPDKNNLHLYSLLSIRLAKTSYYFTHYMSKHKNNTNTAYITTQWWLTNKSSYPHWNRIRRHSIRFGATQRPHYVDSIRFIFLCRVGQLSQNCASLFVYLPATGEYANCIIVRMVLSLEQCLAV